MGTTNKLLQTALQKQTHSSRQLEVAVVTKSFKKCSEISNDLDGMEDDILWDKQHEKFDSDEEGNDMYDDTITHEQIQQMFNEDSDDDEFLSFE